ncbi:MAG: hypothetical protein J6W52_00880 [Bacteroidaceae bacterium]|nr:hypothetical protein [Bacteroidaceae bacterium]
MFRVLYVRIVTKAVQVVVLHVRVVHLVQDVQGHAIYHAHVAKVAVKDLVMAVQEDRSNCREDVPIYVLYLVHPLIDNNT